MKRILEPEIMDEKEQCKAYAEDPPSDTDKKIAELISKEYSKNIKEILDIGCGPGHAIKNIIKIFPKAKITGIDDSKFMLKFAKKQLSKNTTLIQGRIPNLKLNKKFDLITSKYLLHHLPNPSILWDYIKKYSNPKTKIIIMDLFRPESKKKAKEIVEKVRPEGHPLHKRDFYYSLLAAFTVEEVKEQIKQSELKLKIKKIDERNFIAYGEI